MTLTTRGLTTEALTEEGWPIGGSVISDGGGGGSVTAIAGGTIACRLDTIRGNESVAANRISDRSTHLITLPPGTEVSTANTFYVDGRGTYEVTAVRERTDEFTTVIEAVERV